MSQPTPYTPQHSFVADSATVPNFPGQAIDVELNAVKATTDQVRANLALIQRDDGALRNGAVTFDTFSLPLQSSTPIVPLGAGVGAFLSTPNSANFLGAVPDASGNGALVFANQANHSSPNIAGVTNLTGGRIKFPATQVSDVDPNTLDDYEEGTWTPVLGFDTPGDQAVAYGLRSGYYIKIGRLVTLHFIAVASSFIYTTASGNFIVSGLPFPAINDANYRSYAGVTAQGYVRAGASPLGIITGNTSVITVGTSGSGLATAALGTGQVASGGTPAVGGSISYLAAT